MRVNVSVALASFRADARWLDQVHEDPDDQDAVAGYRSGLAVGDDPLWEWLLEGQVAAADQDELKRLREFIQINGPPSDMLGPPSEHEGTHG